MEQNGAKPAFQVNYINPFLESTLKVFKSMLRMDLKVGKPFIKQGVKVNGQVAISTIVMEGGVKGTIRLLLPQKVAERISSILLGFMPKLEDNLVKDIIGEISNIIVGSARKHFDLTVQESFSISVPQVFTGFMSDEQVDTKNKALYIPFSLDEGIFFVEAKLTGK